MEGRRYTNAEIDQIIRQYSDMVYRVIVTRLKDRDSANDIFQEVFLKLVRREKGFVSDEHLKAWLLRVTINECNDHFRSAWVKKFVSYDDTLEKDLDAFYDGDIPEDYVSPGEQAVWMEADEPDDPVRSMTLEAVQQLSPKLRDVVHLFYYEELSIREIAAVLGIEQNAVKTRLSRARETLKKQLGGKYRG